MVEASEAALMNVEGVDVDAAVAAIDAAYRQPDTVLRRYLAHQYI